MTIGRKGGRTGMAGSHVHPGERVLGHKKSNVGCLRVRCGAEAGHFGEIGLESWRCTMPLAASPLPGPRIQARPNSGRCSPLSSRRVRELLPLAMNCEANVDG